MQPLSGNQRPDLLTALMNMSLALRLPREMHLAISSAYVPRLASFLEMLQNPHVLLTFEKVHNPLRRPRETTSERLKVVWSPSVFNIWLRNVLRATTACTFSTSQLPKVVRAWCALYILTWKCASGHNGVHFFDISTSKSALNQSVFYTFDFEICASRHNGVQFFISHLASWLRTRRFSEPTFRPSGATNHWKNAVFCDLPTFSRTWIFFLRRLLFLIFLLLLFSSLTLPIPAFHLSILSEVWLLDFLRSPMNYRCFWIYWGFRFHVQSFCSAEEKMFSFRHWCPSSVASLDECAWVTYSLRNVTTPRSCATGRVLNSKTGGAPKSSTLRPCQYWNPFWLGDPPS